MQVELIALDKLESSDKNVRREKEDVEDLKASIKSHGLIQNLIVSKSKKGKFQVIAGGRRLSALQGLNKDGELADDYQVPCQIIPIKQAEEVSLAENVIRKNMHPADEFEAYAALIDQKKKPAEVAEHFGVTEKHVLQRMKLARVAPKLLQEYREKNIDLEALMAFTLTDDHERQLAVYQGLSKWERSGGHAIRRRLSDEMLRADHRWVKFVGIEHYQAKGGTVRADLFENDQYIEDKPLLVSLMTDKLNQEAEKLKAAGWAWVEIRDESDWQFRSDCDRIEQKGVNVPDELQATYDELEKKIEDLESKRRALWESEGDTDEEEEAIEEQLSSLENRFDEAEAEIDLLKEYVSEEMKHAGCLIYPGYNGKLDIDFGLVLPADKKAAGIQAPEKAKKDGYPEPLQRDLAEYRNEVAKFAILMRPEIAYDLLVFSMAYDLLKSTLYIERRGPNVRLEKHYGRVPQEDPTHAAQVFEKSVKEIIATKWAEETDAAIAFDLFQALSEEEKRDILAYCVAQSLKPQLYRNGDYYERALQQTGCDVPSLFRPTADNFFKRINKQALLDIVKELQGEEEAKKNGKLKKSGLVEMLDNVFVKPDLHDVETWDRICNWLPKGFAFDGRDAEQK